jgi:hypothetical protein
MASPLDKMLTVQHAADVRFKGWEPDVEADRACAPVEQLNAALAQEVAQEIKTLTGRRSFGLNFERHMPESVELTERVVRRGDKARFRPPRGAESADVD